MAKRKVAVVEGDVLEDGEWTPEQAADHVCEAWQNAVDSIVETGRRLDEAKSRIVHGKWSDAVTLMPFSEGTARKLMTIARHPDLANRSHGNDLPASWTTLFVLAQLPAGEVSRRIEAGEITPELERAQAEEWTKIYAAARQETLNAWSGAVDGLTAALSYAKTYAPPDPIPQKYVQVDEFMKRLKSLTEITENWRPG